MILQGSLRIEYNNESFGLMVKTFLKNGIYYFFVSDKGKENALLSGHTLELTYNEVFVQVDKEAADYKNIPDEIKSAVENVLLENKQLWFY